jgi:uncharacterized protein involved in exopolysaccharide biosynthesis
MKQQSILMQLLQQREKVKETNWYLQHGDNMGSRVQGAYRDLEKKLNVVPSREADFIAVSMTCGSGKEAALIVNELVDLFVRNYGATKKSEATDKLTVFVARRDKIQQELEYANTLLKQVSESLPRGFVDLEITNYRDTSTLRFDNLQIQQDGLALQISQLQGVISSLQRQATGPINEQVKDLVETDPIMISLAQQKALLESLLAGQLTRLGDGHREVKLIQERINETETRREARRSEIAEQVRRSNLANAQDSLVAFLGQWEELDKRRLEALKQKQDFDRARSLYEQRMKTRDERQVALDALKSQIEKQRIIAEDPETAKVRSVGDAPEPTRVSFPRWQLFFPGGFFLGFMLGLGLAFAIELLNDLIRTPSDVGKYLHIPLLGVIPDADEDEQIRDTDLCHVINKAPYSIISESYRRLRTNVEISSNERPNKIILLGSGMPGEGNTTVAVNLASAMAARERKVLLIDANFRRPSLETVFANKEMDQTMQNANMGLGDLLAGQSTSQEIIMNSSVKNIDIIYAGTIPSHPAELLGGKR